MTTARALTMFCGFFFLILLCVGFILIQYTQPDPACCLFKRSMTETHCHLFL